MRPAQVRCASIVEKPVQPTVTGPHLAQPAFPTSSVYTGFTPFILPPAVYSLAGVGHSFLRWMADPFERVDTERIKWDDVLAMGTRAGVIVAGGLAIAGVVRWGV